MLTFKIKAMAELLGVHRNTVRNWILKKKLPATPAPAKQYRVSESNFRLFCEQQNIAHEIFLAVLDAFPPSGQKKNKPLKSRHARPPEKIGAVLVVGGGIAGIQAAMELADAGFFVYLVEQTSGIGGTMAQLDKTFPTDDCASCIVLPRLVQCGRHKNVELITQARVRKVEGSAGHFVVTVKKKPDYIDPDKCIACGICAQRCPITMDDEFNFNISKKKAVYIRYDQSVPLKYSIDPSACIYFTLGKCKACEKFCPTGAVNFSQKETTRELHVGAAVLAPGFQPFDPSPYDFYGYRQTPDVVTSLEFERLLSVSGPNQGKLIRPSDARTPKKIAWLQCVGSRNLNNCGNSYCSNICCMAAVKQALAATEHALSPDIERTIFYMDLRSHGKESENYFERAKARGVRFIRAIPHTLEAQKDGSGVRMRYQTEQGKQITDTFDMLVLSIGFEAPKEARALAAMFQIKLDINGFTQNRDFAPVETSREGVYVVGAFSSPKAIARSVVQASAAAACASGLLAEKKDTLIETDRYPRERAAAMVEQPSVGVFVCSCGTNIAGTVDVPSVVKYAAQLPGVTYVENNLFSCSADAQESIIEKIKQFNLNRVVIAACTPRTHEPLFQETLRRAEINEFMVEMANIRNQNAWVHQADAVSATYKAKDQVRMAVAKVAHNYPLRREPIRVNQTALIIGGGIAGMTCALTLSGLGISTVLVEKSGRLGGNALNIDASFKNEPVAPLITEMTRQIQKSKHIQLLQDATLTSVSGSIGAFSGEISQKGKKIPVKFGAAIMATGAREGKTAEYFCGKDPRVMTQTEFDARLLYTDQPISGEKQVVFIQCVGSREPGRPYCSRICCVHTVKAAIQAKKQDPRTKIFVLHRDMRTYGEWETYYTQARQMGVVFIRYKSAAKPQVVSGKNYLSIKTVDPVVRQPVEIHADYLVLATGVVADRNRDLAALFKFNVNPDGFFNGAHPKLKPVDLSVAGLFLAGICNYPKPLDESIEEAQAAAHRAFILLSRKRIESEAIKAFVTDRCDGCALCIDVCPFQALSISKNPDPDDSRAHKVSCDPALCQGCGICAATCPSDGIMVHGFTRRQIKAQVRAAVTPHIDRQRSWKQKERK